MSVFPLKKQWIALIHITKLALYSIKREKARLQKLYPNWWKLHGAEIIFYPWRFKIEFQVSGSQSSEDYPDLVSRIDSDFDFILSLPDCSSGDFRQSLKGKGENMGHLAEAVFRSAYLFVLYQIGRSIGERILFHCLKENIGRHVDKYQITVYQDRELPQSFIVDIVDLIFSSYLGAAVNNEPFNIRQRLVEKIRQYRPDTT